MGKKEIKENESGIWESKMDVGKFLFKPKLVIYKFRSMEGCQFFNCCPKGSGLCGWQKTTKQMEGQEKEFVIKE